MSKISDITGVILAGGQSTRFGQNKALVPFQGVPLIERVVNVMRTLFEDLLIVTNHPQDYAALDIPMVSDLVPDKGPLGGIVTALHESMKDRIFAVACDMPLLDPGVIREVIEKGRGFEAAIPVCDGTAEYLMALYSQKLSVRMSCCLQGNHLSLEEFCGRLTQIAWIPIEGNSSVNVNTRKDLERLEKEYAH